jgi:hypothetical protein
MTFCISLKRLERRLFRSMIKHMQRVNGRHVKIVDPFSGPIRGSSRRKHVTFNSPWRRNWWANGRICVCWAEIIRAYSVLRTYLVSGALASLGAGRCWEAEKGLAHFNGQKFSRFRLPELCVGHALSAAEFCWVHSSQVSLKQVGTMR